jgi:hypothetical protein
MSGGLKQSVNQHAGKEPTDLVVDRTAMPDVKDVQRTCAMGVPRQRGERHGFRVRELLPDGQNSAVS